MVFDTMRDDAQMVNIFLQLFTMSASIAPKFLMMSKTPLVTRYLATAALTMNMTASG